MSGTQDHKDMAIIKNTAILVGWITGLVLIAGLVWFFTQPVRNRFLSKAVNQVLEQSGDPRRLGAPVTSGAIKAGVSKIGSWYTLTENNVRQAGETGRVVIFTFICEGTFFPCAAVVSPGGKVEEIIPLNNHGERMLKRISPEILKLYIRRIEGAES